MKVREIRVVLLNIRAIFSDGTLHYMAGFLTPSCKHGKKTISHIRLVMLNKYLQLGI